MKLTTTTGLEPSSVTSGSQAFTQLRGWVTSVLGGLAAFSGIMYAIGYLVTLAQMRMLGAGMVDHSNQEILKRVIAMPLLSIICIAAALLTWRGFLLAVIMLVLYLRPGIGGLLSAQPVAGPDDADPPSQASVTPPATGTMRVPRVLRRIITPLVLSLVVVVSVLAVLVSGIVLNQDGLLLSRQQTSQAVTADNEASENLPAEADLEDDEDLPKKLARLLTGCEQLTLEYLMQDDTPRRRLYGLLLMAVFFCLTLWLGLWFHLEARITMASPWHRLVHLILIGAGLLVFVQMLLIPLLYGYLVVNNDFPAIETRWEPGWGVDAQTGDEPIPPTTSDKNFQSASLPAPRTVLIMGHRRGMTIVYSPEHKQIWNVPDSELNKTSKQLQTQSPFDTALSEVGAD